MNDQDKKCKIGKLNQTNLKVINSILKHFFFLIFFLRNDANRLELSMK